MEIAVSVRWKGLINLQPIRERVADRKRQRRFLHCLNTYHCPDWYCSSSTMSHDDKLIGCNWTRGNRRGKQRRGMKILMALFSFFGVFRWIFCSLFPSWYWECLLVWLNITNLYVVCVCRGTLSLSLQADIYWSVNCRVCVFGRKDACMICEKESISGISVSLSPVCSRRSVSMLVFFELLFDFWLPFSPLLHLRHLKQQHFFILHLLRLCFFLPSFVILESD